MFLSRPWECIGDGEHESNPQPYPSEPLAPDEANHPAGANLDHAVEPALALLSSVTNGLEPHLIERPSVHICPFERRSFAKQVGGGDRQVERARSGHL